MKLLKSISFVLLPLIFLTNCKKEKEKEPDVVIPPVALTLLSKIGYGSGPNKTYDYYTYDEKRRISKIVQSNKEIVYSYDGDKLSLIETENKTTKEKSVTTISYAAGKPDRALRKIYKSEKFDGKVDYLFRYNNEGKGDVIIGVSSSDGLIPFEQYVLEYSGKNLSLFKNRISKPVVMEYTYDDKKSIYSDCAVAQYTGLDPVDRFSANNMVKSRSTNEFGAVFETTMVYTYNSDSFPISAVKTTKSSYSTGPGNTSTITYEYITK